MADIVRRGDFPLTEWDPFRIMRLMPQAERDMWMPHFDVRENGNSIRIIADVPGAKRDDLEISITGNRLIVSGHRESEVRHKDENMHTWERQSGQFSRAFTLPDTADCDHVTSDLQDGVLTIVVPMKAGAHARKIQIGGAKPKS